MDINKIVYTPVFYLIVYIAAVNLYGFIVMGIDKWKSTHKKWRISEKAIFITAFLGGALGVYVGMKVFHHKTLHNKFRYGIPLILALHIAVLLYIFIK